MPAPRRRFRLAQQDAMHPAAEDLAELPGVVTHMAASKPFTGASTITVGVRCPDVSARHRPCRAYTRKARCRNSRAPSRHSCVSPGPASMRPCAWVSTWPLCGPS